MSDTKTSSPNFNLGEQSTVTIKVSSKAKTQTFVVHKSFICYYSPFFTAAFNGSFKEGETQHLDLEDIHPSAFAAFIHWLYTQRILWQSGDQGHGATMGDIIELWALGDRFLIPRLSNEALKILSRQDWFLYPQNTSAFLWRRIYETTTKGSKLRQFMIRIGSEVLFDRAYAKDAVALEQYPHEMLADAIVWRRDYHAPAGINFGGLDWPVDDETLREYYLDENETKPSFRKYGTKIQPFNLGETQLMEDITSSATKTSAHSVERKAKESSDIHDSLPGYLKRILT